MLKIFLLLFSIHTFGSNVNIVGESIDKKPCDKEVPIITKERCIDLNIKSTRGWLRLLNNKDKYEKYKTLGLTDLERKELINCLTNYSVRSVGMFK